MVVIEKNKENKMFFDEIDVGEVFKINNEIFMKIDSDVNNAVSLQTGICEWFKAYNTIEVVDNAKVVIGD